MLNDQLRLRTIVVSATDAMQTVQDPVERELIQARIFELLDDLRDRIARDGADSELLARIEHLRRTRWA
jgi:hypothetical protein